MSPEASLAEAEAARRREERRGEDAAVVNRKLERLEAENDIAARLRIALGGHR